MSMKLLNKKKALIFFMIKRTYLSAVTVSVLRPTDAFAAIFDALKGEMHSIIIKHEIKGYLVIKQALNIL